ncbi:MAG: hypothetical protein K6D94_01975 [Clostridiales bacterium]|nr:hypothetical protein [Clostridiales bacterium]
MTAVLFACSAGAGGPSGSDPAAVGSAAEAAADKQTVSSAETAASETEPSKTEAAETGSPETEAPPAEPEPVSFEPVSPSVAAANADKNAVQGRFADPSRSAFEISNRESVILCSLKGENKNLSVSAAGGDAPLGEIDSYIKTADGREYYSSKSFEAGRMNSYRLGYYYYDFRVHDLGFMSGEPDEGAPQADPVDHLAGAGKKWGRNDVGKLTYEDHTLSYEVSSSYDPYIYSDCSFPCDEYTAVHAVIHPEKATGGQFFIIAGGMTGYNAQQSVSFTLDAGEWNDIIVPINAVPDYDGTVRGFRIDIGAAAGEKVEITTLEFVSSGPSQAPVKLERILHTYPDKTHEHMRIIASSPADGITEYGETVSVAADDVEKVYVSDGSSVTEWDGSDISGLAAAAAVVRGRGAIGYIVPDMYYAGGIKVSRSGGKLTMTHAVERTGRLSQGLSQSLAHRIYVSGNESMEAFAEAVRVERNPISVEAVSGDGAYSRGYDPYSGQYVVGLDGSDFNKAYYDEPDREYSVTVMIKGDGRPRKLYIDAYTDRGNLECAALLDSAGKLLPVPLEVSKNFCGEYEEPFYDPTDDAYGETRFPMMSEGGVQKITVLDLYQNWGVSPLRQLSSIQFHIPYYHLSYGVTETNCIAPYFVYGRDGWTLPDFRAQSAPLWDSQPQHTSVGRLYLPFYTDASGRTVRSELQRSVIDSAGPVYPDVTMYYLTDDGKMKASYRHLEMPWSDENRTMYSFRLDVTDDIVIGDFARDFRIFEFDGRGLTFTRLGYLAEDGSETVRELAYKGGSPADGGVIKLGGECPYFDYYLVSGDHDTVNFGLIVKSSDIVIEGKAFGGAFVLHDSHDGGNTVGSLSLDLGSVTLREGDHIYADIILLPWGTTDTPDDGSVRLVRRDTCLGPYKIDVSRGSLMDDAWMPKVRAENGEAEFTVSGGSCGTKSGNALAVRVYGFESSERPSVLFGGETAHIKPDSYRDMQVYLDEDGTYSFAFVVTPELINAGEVDIAVRQER